MRKHELPAEALANLRSRLETCAARSAERKGIIRRTAELYGVSPSTVYRALRNSNRPRSVKRADHGRSRAISKVELIRYCEIIAALKLRTTNKKGHRLSTRRAIELLEQTGIETEQGLVKAEPGLLKRSSIDRHLKHLGYDGDLLRIQPVVVRFQAEHSNDCWQFDLSPSDLKEIEEPCWIEAGRGNPLLMIYSIVDDRSGAAYQEYRCVYGEDVESALRFLFNAMAPKRIDGFHCQGIPNMLYADNGPITKSLVFRRVLDCLGITLQTHIPKDRDGRRVTSRAKGKVERPFRTVKEAHEVLYHFHKPKTETEANEWLMQYLVHYNQQQHRSEPHSRMEDWLTNLPPEGYRELCSWEKFCSFAREPEHRKVGSDARVSVNGVDYEVAADLAGEVVILWWGLFDSELFVEHNEQRFGPYRPINGPIPLHRYRRFAKTKAEHRADKIQALAKKISVPIGALTGVIEVPTDTTSGSALPQARVPFPEPAPDDPCFPNAIAAKLAIAHYLGRPLGGLPLASRSFIAELVSGTLDKREVLSRVKAHFTPQTGKR